MKFICKRCGEEKEINIFSKEIFGCWCDQCGRKIPHQKFSLLMSCVYYCAFPILMHIVADLVFGKNENFWVVIIMTSVVISIIFYCFWLMGMFLEGRKLPKEFVGEEQELYSVNCSGCGKELQVSKSEVLEGGKVECINCKVVFDLLKDELVDDVESWIAICSFIISSLLTFGMIAVFYGKGILEDRRIFSTLPVLLFYCLQKFVYCLQKSVANRILWHYYQKRRNTLANMKN